MKLIELFDANEFVDERGSIVELKENLIRKNMKHLFISYTKKDDIIRGNHYHKSKKEWFFIIQGELKMKLKHLITGEEEEHVFSDKLKKFIYIGSNIIHTFKKLGPKELILLAIVNEEFDKDNPDTYYYELEI